VDLESVLGIDYIMVQSLVVLVVTTWILVNFTADMG